MEHVILALMLLFAPAAPATELRPYANYLVGASHTHELLAELFVTGRFEGLWGQRGVPMGVTAWTASHGRRPNEHEAVCAALASIQAGEANCGRGPRHLTRRLGFYLTGRCGITPEAQRRARSVLSTVRVLRAFPIDPNREVLTCPAGE